MGGCSRTTVLMCFSGLIYSSFERGTRLSLKIALCYKIIQHLFIFLFSIICSPLSLKHKQRCGRCHHGYRNTADWLAVHQVHISLRTIKIWPLVLTHIGQVLHHHGDVMSKCSWDCTQSLYTMYESCYLKPICICGLIYYRLFQHSFFLA